MAKLQFHYSISCCEKREILCERITFTFEITRSFYKCKAPVHTISGCTGAPVPYDFLLFVFRYGFEVSFGIAIENKICISDRVIINQPIQFRSLKAVIGHFILNGSAVNRNPALISEVKFDTGGVDIKLRKSVVSWDVPPKFNVLEVM